MCYAEDERVLPDGRSDEESVFVQDTTSIAQQSEQDTGTCCIFFILYITNLHQGDSLATT